MKNLAWYSNYRVSLRHEWVKDSPDYQQMIHDLSCMAVCAERYMEVIEGRDSRVVLGFKLWVERAVKPNYLVGDVGAVLEPIRRAHRRATGILQPKEST